MIKPPLAAIFIMGLAAMPLFNAGAQSVQSVATPEKTGGSNLKTAQAAIAEGNKAYKEKHYDVAVVKYQSACDSLPETPLSHTLRGEAIEGFSQASVRLAEQRIAEGRYADAKAVATTVLDQKYNPAYKPAVVLLAHLNDPDYYNPASGPYSDMGKDVKTLLKEAKGFYDSARFDLAYKRYDQVLNLDPTNIEARKGEEMVNAAKLKYADEYYAGGSTRALPVAPDHPIPEVGGGIPNGNIKYIKNKLTHIIIPRIEFREATVRDAIEYLHRKSIELDTTEADPARRGVNIVLKLQSAPAAGDSAAPAGSPVSGTASAKPDATPAISPGDAKISLLLTNIPLAVALDYITKLANLKVRIEPYAVTIVPLSAPDPLVRKEFSVSPGFLQNTGENVQTARELLEKSGVEFPAGAYANYRPADNKLEVCNTEDGLDRVAQFIAAATPPAKAELQKAAAAAAAEIHKIESIKSKLNRIIIPEIDFRGVTVHDAIDYLRKKSIALDTMETDRAHKGASIVMRLDPLSLGSPANEKITLVVKNIPLSEALRYVAELAGLKYRVDSSGVAIVPLSEPTDSLPTKEYYVPPDFLQSTGGGVQTVRELLAKAGVQFPLGTSAKYLPAFNKLVVRETYDNLDLVDEIVDAATPRSEADLKEDERIAGANARNTEALRDKLDRLIIPKIKFQRATLSEVMFELMKTLPGLDSREPKPARRGVNLVWDPKSDALISLTFANASLGELLRQVAGQSGRKARVDPYAIMMVPFSGFADGDFLITQEYQLSPAFFGKRAVPASATAMEILKNAGVEFPQGGGASYFPASGRLFVCDIGENMDLVDKTVDALMAGKSPPAPSPAASKVNAAPNLEDRVDVEKVEKLFVEARDFYDAGRFDLAYKRYTQILDLDPTNIAARKGQKDAGVPGERYILNKLNQLIIPQVDFKDATVREAIVFLHEKSVELDATETYPERKGVDMTLKTVSASSANYKAGATDVTASPADGKITLSLANVPLSEALRRVTAIAGLEEKILPYGVTMAYPPLQRYDVRHPGIETDNVKGGEADYLRRKLNHIILSKIDFKNATVREAIEFLRKKSVELDVTETDPARKGVNIVLKLESAPVALEIVPPAPAVSPADAKITLSLTHVPLAVALDYVTKLAGLKVRVEPYGVSIVPLSAPDGPDANSELFTKKYEIPPGFPGMNVSAEKSREYLERSGVQFPAGAGVNFILTSGDPAVLVVCDTEANLDLVDKIVKAYILAKSAAPGEATAMPSPVSSKEKEEK